jgi:hypothetical protein
MWTSIPFWRGAFEREPPGFLDGWEEARDRDLVVAGRAHALVGELDDVVQFLVDAFGALGILPAGDVFLLAGSRLDPFDVLEALIADVA